MIGYDLSVYDYVINRGHLLLKCFAPFACCLDEEVISFINFQINFHKKLFSTESNPLFFYQFINIVSTAQDIKYISSKFHCTL